MRSTSLRALALAGLTAIALLGPWSARPAHAQGYAYPGPSFPYPGPTYAYQGGPTYAYSPAPSWAYYAYPSPAYTYPGPGYTTTRRTTTLASRRGASTVRVSTTGNRNQRTAYLPSTWDDFR